MRQSQLFTKTQKDIGQDELSKNYEMLVKGGFVHQEMAGVYSFLPLGLRVIKKIEVIIREEMNEISGQEILMPGLHPQHNWEQTGRWDKFDVLFKVSSSHGSTYALGPTHEEIIVPLAKLFIHSHKDLPKTDVNSGVWSKAVYQIQTKFRDEKRAKSGLLRGREFIMKDLYSFHQTPEDLDVYYEEVRRAYTKIFSRLSLNTIITESSGGTFSKLSHEFQIECNAGEDIIFYCESCNLARNKEIVDVEGGREREVLCAHCSGATRMIKAAEAGNIFKLNTKYSTPFELTYTGAFGEQKPVYMGCYGIGISRLMGVIVEVYNDENGIIWPKSVAPFNAHLIVLGEKQEVRNSGEEVYAKLKEAGIEVLYDDRTQVSIGEKFADVDLIGSPYRLVVSERTGDKVEVKKRGEEKVSVVCVEEVVEMLKKLF